MLRRRNQDKGEPLQDMRAVAAGDLIVLLGRNTAEDGVQVVLRRCGLKPQPYDRYGQDNRTDYINRDAGIEIAGQADGSVGTIFLSAGKPPGHAGFTGRLPAGLTFNDTRESARAKLAEPEDSGEPSESSYLGPVGAWDRWAMPNYAVHVTYGLADGRIERVTIMRHDLVPHKPAKLPQTPAAPASAQEHAPSSQGDTNVMQGTEIIQAWLNELEACQPEYGPLLQSTIDVVGSLPAISEDGTIRTVGNRSYWVAVGFTQSYASRTADRRRVEAILAEKEAGEANDERTMVRKEAEADFWESVEAWVESAGVARMRPETLPDWLLRLNVQWNPGDE